jgi:uncharacterized protein YjbI with pentapeptide repeats
MAKSTRTLPPRIDELRLERLDDGDVDDLRAQQKYEGKRFTGSDLGGLDLSGTTFSECAFDGVHADRTGLRGATFSEVAFTRLDAPVFTAPRAQLRDVTVEGSRLGSAELYEGYFNSVRFAGSKLGFVNARGSELMDVVFDGCTIDELDLSGSRLTRVAFVDTTIRSLSLNGSTLANVDLRGAEFSQIDGFGALRGATLSGYQVGMLADSFAGFLGIRVEG